MVLDNFLLSLSLFLRTYVYMRELVAAAAAASFSCLLTCLYMASSEMFSAACIA